MELKKVGEQNYKWSLSVEEFKVVYKGLVLTKSCIGTYEYSTLLGVPYEYGLKIIEEFEEFMKKEGIEV